MSEQKEVKKTVVEEAPLEVAEPAEVVEEAPVKGESAAKAALRAVIEAYKKTNPVKAELKKEEFARKLAAL